MDGEPQGTEVVKREDVEAELEPVQEGRFDLASVDDPTAGLEKAETLVQYMADKCEGPEYIAQIQGKSYPKVDWWTTVGGGLGLFPREESCRELEREGETAYEATVGVYNGQQLVTRASAICSSAEPTWSGRDEYAIRSMAITRATGKAYRIGLSFLPVMAGLEPTPAEEMPRNGGQREHTCIDLDAELGFGKHADKTWRAVAETNPGYIGWLKKEGTDRLCEEDYDKLRPIAEGAVDDDGPEGDPGEPQAESQEWVESWFEDEYGASWMPELRSFAGRHPELPEKVSDWDRLQWASIRDGLERFGEDFARHPAEVMEAEQVEAL